MSFFGFLLTAFAVYIIGMLVYFFVKIILPVILTVRSVNKQSGGASQRQRAEEVFNDGDISLEKPASGQKTSKKKLKDDVGEVVDYQEIN